ncbi:MAG TPA: lipid-binding SYLF domain-containing protein [Hypericibacter adhaerens]|jgi:lipid-binding SYLF domain-containing protein|uniref:Lipoprotein n=1 Tax=Hypericibacter adhaerens TaxID=2602016 RepID=A0A5J6N7A0_9PROT|nr:lipid-binding SYLF domain-containing protein [Hypericibacter adhaerens]QEX22906.1 lipoprotein [Hypericibacter adhaerens]HWA43150.1 lipid-binding SYLF domain-containing protein [Hypericibacter adhaerens]
MNRIAGRDDGAFRRPFARRLLLGAMAAAGAVALLPRQAGAITGSGPEIDADATRALQSLYASDEGAKALGQKAQGILIFPEIAKAGFLIGGAYGEGALRVGGKTVAYYSSSAASYGLQVGIQRFSYVLFLMTPNAINYLNKSDGWEIGVGPSIVVADEGFGKKMTTTTLQAEIYAYIFGQQGLMAGLGIEGTKILKIDR